MASKTLPKILRPILKIYADGKEHSATSIRDDIAEQIRDGKITLPKELSTSELLGCICSVNNYLTSFGLLKEPPEDSFSNAKVKKTLKKRVITHKGLELYKNGPQEITYKYLKEEYSESEKKDFLKGSLKEKESELKRKESAAKTLDLLNKEIAEQKKAAEQAQSTNNFFFFEDPPVYPEGQNTSHTQKKEPLPLPLNREKENTSLPKEIKELEKINQGGADSKMATTAAEKKKTVSLKDIERLNSAMEKTTEDQSEDLFSALAADAEKRARALENRTVSAGAQTQAQAQENFFNDIFAGKDEAEEAPEEKEEELKKKFVNDLINDDDDEEDDWDFDDDEDDSWSESSLDYDKSRYIYAAEAKDTKVPERYFTPPLEKNKINNEKKTLEQLKEDINNKITQYDKKYQETLKNILGTLSEEKLEKLIFAIFRELGYENVTDKERQRFIGIIKVLRDYGGIGKIFVKIEEARKYGIGDIALAYLVGETAGRRGTLVYASNGYFTKDAYTYAKEQDIVLLDRDWLAEAIQNLGIGSKTPWNCLPEIDYDYFKNL